MGTIVIIDDIKKNALALTNALEAKYSDVQVVRKLEYISELELTQCKCVIVLSYMANSKSSEEIRAKTSEISVPLVLIAPYFLSQSELRHYEDNGFDWCYAVDCSPKYYSEFTSCFESFLATLVDGGKGTEELQKAISLVDYQYLIQLYDTDLSEVKAEIIPESLNDFIECYKGLS
jgi:response regulator RpfG family c-di-GMP phosphodiesterase